MRTSTPTTTSTRTRLGVIAGLVLVIGVTGLSGAVAPAGASRPEAPKPTIVLVHGAFADGSGWNAVSDRLQDRGYEVIAPSNPLRSVAGDSAYIRSVLDTIDGPIVLVGHSYGGFVLTNAAAGHPGVEALVYVAAFAPDLGDTVGGLAAANPGSRLVPENLVVRPYPGGQDGYIDPDVFREVFAADVKRDVAATMAASQRPSSLEILDQASGEPAWETVPSWYLVATEDNVIPPATQHSMAERAGATTVEVRSSHVAMVSHPREVTEIIIDAADSVG
jgi:pimeloyl-ACP methyl ester carboxylesterase